jgi:Cu/Ag efflux pump CusA
MAWLVSTSVRFGRLVLAVAVGVLVLTFVQLRDAPVGVYPELMPPAVQIQTEALGLSAAEVEQLVTVPLEQDLLNGVPWLDHITSRSMPGLSAIDLVFEPGTNIYAARQMVQERLTQAHALPNVGSPPLMMEPTASVSRVAMIGLTSREVSLVDLSVLARWKIRPKLMGVPGVASVSVYGQRDRQLQVEVDPARMRARHVSLTQVIETAGNALWVSPLSFVEASTPGTGGFVESPNQRLAVQHVSPIRSPAQLAAVPVEGTPPGAVRLADVARVVEDHQPLIGDALVDGSPSLYLVVDQLPGASPLAVASGVQRAMDELAPGLRGVTVDTSVYQPASYLRSALGSLGLAALLGLMLLVVALGVTLGSWRVTAVAAFAVLLSLAVAGLVLFIGGATFTTMTVLGVGAALGLVVDGAVRDQLWLRSALLASDAKMTRRPDQATLVAATVRGRRGRMFTVAVALVLAAPVLAMDRLRVAFASQAFVAYAVALLAGTLVALVVTPTLSSFLLRASPTGLRAGPLSSVSSAWSRRHPRALGSPVAAWVAAGVLAAGCVALVPQLGARSLLPATRDPNLLVQLASAPGTSLPELDRVASAMADELRSLPGVGDVGAHVGRAVTSDRQVDVNQAELWLSLDEGADYDATTRAIEDVVHGYPGIRSSLTTYGAARVVAAQDPDRDRLVVRVYGTDLGALADEAAVVRAALAKVPGVVDPMVQRIPQQPTVRVQVDLAAAARLGLRPGDVRRDATTLTSGLVVGSLYEDAKIFDVVVWGGPRTRHDLTSLRDLRIDLPDGRGQVRLGDLASVAVGPEPAAIEHHDVSRSVDVVASVHGRPAAEVAADVRAAVAALPMPLEYHAAVLDGPGQARADVIRTVLWAAVAVVFALLLVHAATRSWRRSALLVALLPLAAAGAVAAAFATGGVYAIGPLAGVVAAVVITARHGVMLLRAADPLGRYAQIADGADRRAATDRASVVSEQLVPVLGTALCVGALVLPVALLGPRAGLESAQPFAVALLGGLLSSTAVVLLVLPAFLPVAAPGEPTTEDTHGVAPPTRQVIVLPDQPSSTTIDGTTT